MFGDLILRLGLVRGRLCVSQARDFWYWIFGYLLVSYGVLTFGLGFGAHASCWSSFASESWVYATITGARCPFVSARFEGIAPHLSLPV